MPFRLLKSKQPRMDSPIIGAGAFKSNTFYNLPFTGLDDIVEEEVVEETIQESDEETEVEIEIETKAESRGISPMSSTETLVDVVPRAAVVAAKLEAFAREVPKKKAKRQATLVPLCVAQQRDDIKYRPEGFELEEQKAKKAKSKRVVGEKVWWMQF